MALGQTTKNSDTKVHRLCPYIEYVSIFEFLEKNEFIMTEFTSVTEWGKGLRSRRHEGNFWGDGNA